MFQKCSRRRRRRRRQMFNFCPYCGEWKHLWGDDKLILLCCLDCIWEKGDRSLEQWMEQLEKTEKYYNVKRLAETNEKNLRTFRRLQVYSLSKESCPPLSFL